MTFDLLIGAGSALVLSMFWRKLATQHDAGGIVTRREALDRSVDGFKHPLENLDLGEWVRDALARDADSGDGGDPADRSIEFSELRELRPEPLLVLACSDDMRALLSHLAEIAHEGASGGGNEHAETLRWTARADGAHAMLHLTDVPTGSADCGPLARSLVQWLHGDRNALSLATRERLACCEDIVRHHGGRLYAGPSPLGRLTLTVRLPLRVRHDEQEPTAIV